MALAVCAAPVGTAAPREFYVTRDGSDSNPGTRSKPFLTLERARDAIRAAGTDDARSRPVTVWLGPGDYYRTNALEFTAEDSGVTWRGLQPYQARLLGARNLLLDSVLGPVTDPAIAARLPENARVHVREVDASKAFPPGNPPAVLRSRGFGRPTTAAHCELFYNGRPMTLARYPNEGQWEHIAAFPSTSGQNDDHGGSIGKLESGFHYAGDRPLRWRDHGNIWVHGYWSWDWANSYERISSIDPQARLIRTASPHGLYGFRKGQRFYYLNVLEELDAPGEWWLDADKAKLYFWPPEVASPADTPELLLSRLTQPFLKLTGASNIVVRDLVLEAACGNAIEIRDGANCRVAGCAIRNLGNNAAVISGGTSHAVLGCDISDTGDGGVTLSGGDRRTLRPANHRVDNSHFQRVGRWSKCYVPAVLMNGVGHRASHNLVHDHPHCASLFNGNDHLIEFNEIHHIALETGDVGAIYTGRDYTYRGNRIRHNFIHHTGGVGMGSMGVYMDDCVSGTEISGNIFYKVQRAAFLGGGRDHQVFNNIFVDCNHAVELDGRGLDKAPVWRGMVDKTMRGRLAEVPLELYRQRYPEMKSLDGLYGPPNGPAITGSAFVGVPPMNNLVATNICVGKWLNVYWHAKPDHLELRNNLTNAAPGFVNEISDSSTPRDFALRNNSPAWALGFQKIPVESIGLYPDEYRTNLKR
ncbi:MAG: right-handed parallel beta-helix repeat-containing protein [Candidatus Hydrogenedentes bacterium]|nr:right-handed parallel beta-helix repeat-containing protein [Candidatus Hydrogenedentota bacterium]